MAGGPPSGSVVAGVSQARPSGPSRCTSSRWETSRGTSTPARHLLPGDAQEVRGGKLVVEDDEKDGEVRSDLRH